MEGHPHTPRPPQARCAHHAGGSLRVQRRNCLLAQLTMCVFFLFFFCVFVCLNTGGPQGAQFYTNQKKKVPAPNKTRQHMKQRRPYSIHMDCWWHPRGRKPRLRILRCTLGGPPKIGGFRFAFPSKQGFFLGPVLKSNRCFPCCFP